MIDAYARGVDVVILDAPTGSGKTIIGESIRRLLKPKNAMYVCHSKTLQRQFEADFPYARVLMGKGNYPTYDKPHLFKSPLQLSALDCTMTKGTSCDDCVTIPRDDAWHCNYCHPTFNCPYKVAKFAVLDDDCPIGVTNTAYFLAEANWVGGLSGRELVIADEFDTLHSILLDQIEVAIPERRCKMYGIEPPDKKTVEESWLAWVEDEAIPKLDQAAIDAHRAFWGRKPTLEEARELKYVGGLRDKIKQLPAELRSGNMVYDGYAEGDIRFKPINIDKHAPELLWQHSRKWLLMSATVIDPRGEMERLGLNHTNLSYQVISVPSTFPPERRPIFIKPYANMVYNEREAEWPKMAAGIKEVLSKYDQERVLIHTVSYEFTRYIVDQLAGHKLFTYTKAKERDDVLRKFRKTSGGVLVAPSMDRGVSLDYDDCRVVIIPKIPTLNLSDKVVSKRLYAPGGRLWYRVETLRTLVQMAGRAMRSEDDASDIWVLDEQFLRIWRESRHLLPGWFREAVDMSGGSRKVFANAG